MSWIRVEAPLPGGAVRVGVTARGVVATEFGVVGEDSVLPGDEEKAERVRAEIGAYFAGTRKAFGLPLDWGRTEGLQRTVLQTLHRQVGYGRTVTYGELARLSGAFPADDFEAPRTVGQIMGSNPLFLLVPCHRVVASDGLGGFGGGELGMSVKRWLLTLEGVLPPTLDWNGPG